MADRWDKLAFRLVGDMSDAVIAAVSRALRSAAEERPQWRPVTATEPARGEFVVIQMIAQRVRTLDGADEVWIAKLGDQMRFLTAAPTHFLPSPPEGEKEDGNAG